MVRGIGFLAEARTAILHHHERLDGKGYPYGLRGTEIPEPARVVAVADAFDAMTSTRSYSRARPVPAALAELARAHLTLLSSGTSKLTASPCSTGGRAAAMSSAVQQRLASSVVHVADRPAGWWWIQDRPPGPSRTVRG